MSYQFARKVQSIPPWWLTSRYQSFAPSHAHTAARCFGCSAATWNAFIA
jgi:hypothetical protein